MDNVTVLVEHNAILAINDVQTLVLYHSVGMMRIFFFVCENFTLTILFLYRLYVTYNRVLLPQCPYHLIGSSPSHIASFLHMRTTHIQWLWIGTNMTCF